MLATHLLNINDLNPDELCNFIETRYYSQIDALLKNLDGMVAKLEDSCTETDTLITVSLMLYSRMADEVKQLLRLDRQIIFPLIKAATETDGHRHLPNDNIHRHHERIMKLLAKLRHQANDFVVQPGWSQPFKIFCDDSYSLEQCLQQVIYLKENLLLPKMNAAATDTNTNQ